MLVTGIGQCSLDYLAVVDSYPSMNTKKEVIRWEEQGGGPVATALVTLSRLGVQSNFYGIIGDDTEGKKIRQSLIDEGVAVEGLMRRKGAFSQVAFIVIEKGSGKRTIFWKKSSGKELKPHEVPPDFLQKSSFLLLDGLMADISLYAAREARRLNIPVMLDAGRLRKGMLDIAKNSDYVVASEEFAKEIGWSGQPEAFQKELRKHRFENTTITLGEQGSITFYNGEIISIPAFRVDAVDTTGAGDVFHGGYIYGLLQGWNIADTVRFASAVAATKCMKIGGRAGIPDMKSVMEFLREKGIALNH